MIKNMLLTSILMMGIAAGAVAGDVKGHTNIDRTNINANNYSGLTVTLGGSIDAQAGFKTNEKSAFKYKTPLENGAYGEFNVGAIEGYVGKLNEFNFVNSTKFWIKADGTNEAYGFQYGGLIKMFADTSDAKEQITGYMFDTANSVEIEGIPSWNRPDVKGPAMQTMLYVKGVFGKVEVGSYTGASHAMQVDARTFARATGADDARRWWNQFTYRGYLPTSYAYLEAPTLPTNSESRYGLRTVNANKITYYTPEFGGLMLGVSYIPDTEVNGTIAKAGSVTKTMNTVTPNQVAKAYTRNFAPAYRNVFEGGIHYQGQFNDFGIKAALLGQVGEAKKTLFTKDIDPGTGDILAGTVLKNNKNLSAWEAGLNLSYMGWTVGGSYGEHGKSGNFNRVMWDGNDLNNAGSVRAKKTTYWTAGLGFEQGPVGASFTYFESKQGLPGINTANTAVGQYGDNKLEQYTFGLDYKVAPGFMPYVEVTAFRMKDKHYAEGAGVPLAGLGGARVNSPGNRGTIILVGSKLEF